MSTGHRSIFQALAAEFHPSEIRERPQGGKKLRYITARVAMNRLDEVFGGENWKDEYFETEKGLKCRLWFRIPGDSEWIWKEDGGAAAEMSEADNCEKSAYSDAFKRAAVKLGVARYLYNDGIPIYPEEHVNGEVVEQAAEDPPKVKSAPGLFSEDHQKKVPAFLKWLDEKCEARLVEWRESWAPIVEAAMADGHEVPEKIEDPANKHQLKNHIWKWAVKTGRIEGVSDHAGAKPAQVEAFLTKLALKHHKAIAQEIDRYMNQEAGKVEEKVFRQHPDIAPPGYFEDDEPGDDAAPAMGDAYEAPALSEAGKP